MDHSGANIFIAATFGLFVAAAILFSIFFFVIMIYVLTMIFQMILEMIPNIIFALVVICILSGIIVAVVTTPPPRRHHSGIPHTSGFAAVSAAIFTNPLEVVKVRMQLQGQLQAKGHYAVHYRNVFHASYQIATKEGILAMQKGLVPALWYQFIMNGTRLGLYHILETKGFTKNKHGKIDPLRSVMAASFSGAISASVGSPFCLIKTHLQSKANVSSIAVGHQHKISGMSSAVRTIFMSHGVLGLWRGVSTTLVRVVVVSAVQLPTFAKAREFVTSKGYFPEGSLINAFIASLLSGLLVSVTMAPFDLVSTRYYNQGVDSSGKGLVYSTVRNCTWKIYKAEGIMGYFKGWTAIYFRLGPHTLLSLVIWDQFKYQYKQYSQSAEKVVQ